STIRPRREPPTTAPWSCSRPFSTQGSPSPICFAAPDSQPRPSASWWTCCWPSPTPSTPWCSWDGPWSKTGGWMTPSPRSTGCSGSTPNTRSRSTTGATPRHGSTASAPRSRIGSGWSRSGPPGRSPPRPAPRCAPPRSWPISSRSRWRSEMAIQGPLKELGIHDVFQLLDLGRKTGALRISSALRQNEGTIWFHHAAVVAASIQSNPHPIGSALLRSGKIREEDLSRACALQLTPFEWRVLAAADAERDIHAIALSVGEPEFNVARALFGLDSAGVVLLRDPALESARAAPRADAEALLRQGEEQLRSGSP